VVGAVVEFPVSHSGHLPITTSFRFGVFGLAKSDRIFLLDVEYSACLGQVLAVHTQVKRSISFLFPERSPQNRESLFHLQQFQRTTLSYERWPPWGRSFLLEHISFYCVIP
jgi:hypothetical protein